MTELKLIPAGLIHIFEKHWTDIITHGEANITTLINTTYRIPNNRRIPIYISSKQVKPSEVWSLKDIREFILSHSRAYQTLSDHEAQFLFVLYHKYISQEEGYQLLLKKLRERFPQIKEWRKIVRDVHISMMAYEKLLLIKGRYEAGDAESPYVVCCLGRHACLECQELFSGRIYHVDDILKGYDMEVSPKILGLPTGSCLRYDRSDVLHWVSFDPITHLITAQGDITEVTEENIDLWREWIDHNKGSFDQQTKERIKNALNEHSPHIRIEIPMPETPFIEVRDKKAKMTIPEPGAERLNDALIDPDIMEVEIDDSDSENYALGFDNESNTDEIEVQSDHLWTDEAKIPADNDSKLSMLQHATNSEDTSLLPSEEMGDKLFWVKDACRLLILVSAVNGTLETSRIRKLIDLILGKWHVLRKEELLELIIDLQEGPLSVSAVCQRLSTLRNQDKIAIINLSRQCIQDQNKPTIPEERVLHEIAIHFNVDIRASEPVSA